jgi:hypothetical protein
MRITILLTLACASIGCGEEQTDSVRVCLSTALATCSALEQCGLIDGTEVAACPGAHYDACCEEYGECEGDLPMTRDELQACVDSIQNSTCETVEGGEIPTVMQCIDA